MNCCYQFTVTCRNFGLSFFVFLAALCALNAQTAPAFTLKMATESAQQNDTVSLPLTVKNFDQIISAQFAFTWAPDDLEFLSLDFSGGNLLLSNANFNPMPSDQLRFSWFDPVAVGVSLSDGDTIFSIKFKVLTADSGFVPVLLDTDVAFQNEIVGGAINAMPNLAYLVSGVYANMAPTQALQSGDFFAEWPMSCSNPMGSIVVDLPTNGTPPFTLNWTGPNGYVASGFSIDSLDFGYYNGSLMDNAGSIVQIMVFLAGAPFNISGQVQSTTCAQYDGCIFLSPVPSNALVSYTWSNNMSTQDICGLGAGTYTVTATFPGSCVFVDTFEVLSGDSLLVNIETTPANCANNQFGTALALPINGQSPYSYFWSTAANGQLQTGLIAGYYALTVIDALGCSGTAETYIDDVTILDWDLWLQPVCGGPGGGAMLLLSGNPTSLQYPVTINWDNGSSEIVAAPAGDTLGLLQMLPSGLYGLIVMDSIGCVQILEESLNCFGAPPPDSAALVWPGDADNNNAVNHHDLLSLGLAYGATGPARANATTDWLGQPASDWPQNTTGNNPVNFKNLDTNGDGIIDAADTLAIVANWSQVIDPEVDNPFAAPIAVPGMGPVPAPQMLLMADSFFAGQMVYVPVVVGSAGAPADSVHGLAFSISYDPAILQPVYFEPLASWLGDPADGLISVFRDFPGQHRIDVALSRTDGLPAGGYGVIGRTFIIIEDDIFFKGNDDLPESGGGNPNTVATTLFVRNVRARTPSNTQIEMEPENTEIVISKTVGTTNPQNQKVSVALWPNPTSEQVYISSSDAALQSVVISDMWGQIQGVYTDLQTNLLEIPIQNWPKGAYVTQVFTNRGVAIQLFFCQ